MSDALKLNGITKGYNLGVPTEVQVLNGVDFTLGTGEVVGMVAPSGAGKSTLLHIAGLLDAPDKGYVEIGGYAVGSGDRARTRLRRQDVGFVYQFHHLLQEFTALENVVLPQLANGVSQKDARFYAIQLMDMVGLKDRTGHRPAELSGGEKQRVAFCRALANKPKVLLADEPTGNLDPSTSETVFAALMDLVRATDMSAFIATHNIELAARMDRRVRLDAGTLLTA